MDPWLLFIISSNIPDDAASSKEPAEEAVTVAVNSNLEQEEVKYDGERNSMVGDVSLCKYSLVISLA